MKRIQYLNLHLIAVFIFAAGFFTPETARSIETVDHSLFDALLKQHVLPDGNVDYQGFQKDEARLDSYLAVLEQAAPDTLSRNEKFAFYINAYNAWTVKLILSGYPGVKSIKDLGGFFSSPWKKKIARINGKVMTLDDIEHAILRPEFKDPRVHFAINCASKSCPVLRPEAYVASRLDSQLDDATGNFLHDPQHNYLKGNDLYVSSIFKWFGEDFQNDIVGFFVRHARGKQKDDLIGKKQGIKVRYLDYDWSLNGK